MAARVQEARLAGSTAVSGADTRRHDAVQRSAARPDGRRRENRRGIEERTREEERERGGKGGGERRREVEGDREGEDERARWGRDRESTIVGGRNKSARPPYDGFPTSGRVRSFSSPPGYTPSWVSSRTVHDGRCEARPSNVTLVTFRARRKLDDSPRRSATADGRRRENERDRER